MKLHRLFDMTATEIGFRGRQHFASTVDRLMARSGRSSPKCRYDAHDGDISFRRLALLLERDDSVSIATQLQRRFDQIAPYRFFAGASEDDLAAHIDAHCVETRQEIIEHADAVCQGQFDILGYGRLSFGSPVDWQFDAVSGKKTAPAHGSQIRYLDKESVGDSKVVWELNRHQWLLDLGQAYRLTGEARYAECFARLVKHWMKQNPPGFGVNWSSSLEVAMRLISWCWALFLFRGASAFTPELFVQMLGWIQSHARYVERNLSRYFSPNTHLTGEALGLFYTGILFPELEGARRWLSMGHKILLEEMDRQILPGGVYFEQSTCYQFYTVEMYLHFIILARRNHVVIPASAKGHLERMVDFLLQVRRPDGTVPQIGDTDGGWLLPLKRREPGDCRGLFATAAVLLNKPQFAWAAENAANDALGSGMEVETCWLLGSQAYAGSSAADTALESAQKISPPPTVTLRCFHEGGYVVLRSGWDERAHQMIFDTGPLGCGVSGGHGHADLLSIQCTAWGENYLVDAGTFCYTADTKWRRFFRSTQAHSTVMVDGRGQAESNGPFSWHHRPSSRLLNCTTMPGFCLAEAEHDAWASLEDPVIHRRRVLFVESRYWLVIDDISGEMDHRIDLRYQFAPLSVEIEDDGWFRARGDHSALLGKTFADVSFSTSIARGQSVPPAGWYSPNYGQKIPAPALTYSATAMLPLRVVTLLYPIPNREGKAPAVTAQFENRAKGKTVSGLTVTSPDRESITIEDHRVIVHSGIPTCVASLEY